VREKFELCVKVVGLLFLCSGVLVVLGAILLFFCNFFTDDAYLASTLSDNAFSQQFQEQLAHRKNSMLHVRTWAAVYCSLLGAFTAALGVYLMRSNNLIVRLCYPRTDGRVQPGAASRPQAVDVTVSSTTGKGQEMKNRADTRYAPPGYSQ
jgi:hypothetical protein